MKGMLFKLRPAHESPLLVAIQDRGGILLLKALSMVLHSVTPWRRHRCQLLKATGCQSHALKLHNGTAATGQPVPRLNGCKSERLENTKTNQQVLLLCIEAVVPRTQE